MASDAARNLYRLIEAGACDIGTAPAAEPQVAGLGAFFGAQVGWSPGRESGPQRRVEVLEDGSRSTVEACGECGSGLTADTLPEVLVCMGCMRSAKDGDIAAILAKHPAPKPGELGPVELAERALARRKAVQEAARKKGKPKAETDAYLMGEATLAKLAS